MYSEIFTRPTFGSKTTFFGLIYMDSRNFFFIAIRILAVIFTILLLKYVKLIQKLSGTLSLTIRHKC